MEGTRFHIEAFRAALGPLAGDETATGVVETSHYPREGLLDFQEVMAGDVLKIRYRLAGLELSAINDATESDASAVVPRSPVTLVPTLMFPHRSGKGIKALREYCGLFDRVFGSSALGQVAMYPADAVQKGENALLHGRTVLAGQHLAAMDSGMEQPFTFSFGLSLLVQASSQEQIDALWETLSTDPEAEICGWCLDEFGMHWQVSPTYMTELMHRRVAWDVMIHQRKVVAAGYEALPSA